MFDYPQTKQEIEIEDFYGVKLTDNYAWLETKEDADTEKWVDAQNEFSKKYFSKLKNKEKYASRLSELLYYDYTSFERKVTNGERVFFYKKAKTDEKHKIMTKENSQSEEILLLDPNKWAENDTLAFIAPSRTGKYLGYGISHGGDENPTIYIMEVATKKILSDKCKGWHQEMHEGSWIGDDAFYYFAKPLAGEVPEKEEFYWHSVYYHKLGTDSKEDKKVFYDEKVKEYFCSGFVSECGKYELFQKSSFYKNVLYLRNIGDENYITVEDSFDAAYDGDIFEDKLYITTDKDAPKFMVYVTDIQNPSKENWKVFIPQSEDKLEYITGINGKIYAVYLHNAYNIIKIYSPDGEYLRELKLPQIGTAGVIGKWNSKKVGVHFTSYNYPTERFDYFYETDELVSTQKMPYDFDASKYEIKQVFYPSKDGTKISMFIIQPKKSKTITPFFLYGYGGFAISLTPGFSAKYAVLLENGISIAVANLRGGGEYGEEWHHAGMKENKQNVFDDFIGAAEYLIKEKYTSNDKICISGGSNGGLLVGAVMVQRPDLFKVVECAMPLLDMVKYHRFGIANIWSEEYGNTDNEEDFKYIYKYSPYQNVKEDVKYPAALISGSDNDARTDPMHPRKFAAILQERTSSDNIILYRENKDSGHHGGTTIKSHVNQIADDLAFVISQIV